jgi:hypothetical protein
MPQHSAPAHSLPLVVQLGFAGSRQLLDVENGGTPADPADFETKIQQWMGPRLKQLHADLGLQPRHFFCGVSAIAVGADTVFARTCQASGIPLRVFLPQTRDEFLHANGSSGPDFNDSQRAEALRLLDTPHVIQERLVSDSRHRAERFQDANREIVRVSDVLLCLLRKGSDEKVGGTADLINHAVQRGKPVLVAEVSASKDGELLLDEHWRLPLDEDGAPQTNLARAFHPPTEPETLAQLTFAAAPEPNCPIPVGQYVNAIKTVASLISKRTQRQFKWMAAAIIVAHVAATVLASLALGFNHLHWEVLPTLLKIELVMLGVGLISHLLLHHSQITRRWAESRLLAEVTRSVRSVGKLHVYMQHFFTLPFPRHFAPLLRTINVLHLQCTRPDKTPWEQKRDQYVKERLTKVNDGQIDYYRKRAQGAKRWLWWVQFWFFCFWSTAFLATLLKLFYHHDLSQGWAGVFGTLAIVMPVLAAGALSFAAALDKEAQKHTYQEMHEFLKKQTAALVAAGSEREFAQLLLETETHLLAETTTWFSRRSFIVVN